MKAKYCIEMKYGENAWERIDDAVGFGEAMGHLGNHLLPTKGDPDARYRVMYRGEAIHTT